MLSEMHLGDCLEVLKRMPDASVDSVVTDPPYGLSFMGKKWDYDVPSVEIWREVLRVLKPGGHMLAACGTRTQHRMAVNIEDAGFEIRDVVTWHYGSGFPKSLDVSKAIDKQAGAKRQVIARTGQRCGVFAHSGTGAKQNIEDYEATITAPSTDDAKKWSGYGTALKPATEFWTLARKPLEKGLTVASNVLKHGCGGLNIDASRIESEPIRTVQGGKKINGNNFNNPDGNGEERCKVFENTQGRWPANVIFECTCDTTAHTPECPAGMLDAQSGVLGKSAGGNSRSVGNQVYGSYKDNLDKKPCGFGDSGGASRFFYVAKASKSERNRGLERMPKKLTGNMHEVNLPMTGVHGQTGKPNKPMEPQQNFHPTVKPIRLMEYLIRLITQPGGTVLDPFAGSGSTGVAAKRLGFNFIGIEMNEEYIEIARKRIEAA